MLRNSLASVLAIGLAVGATGCAPDNRGSGASHLSGVAAALASSADLGSDQIATFQVDIRSGWAVAYDPAVPPGCAPGGLHRPAGERPCQAYVLQRQKTTWKLRAVGAPGSLVVPPQAPADLGDPANLSYMGR